MSHYLTNHWNDVTLLKLDPSPGSDGPFLVSQLGIDSDDSSQKERSFILRRDGHWIELLVHYSFPREERDAAIFRNVREVMELLGTLPQHPQVFRRDLTHEEKARALAELEAVNVAGIHEHVRAWKLEQERL
jgi:hypothetical protein